MTVLEAKPDVVEQPAPPALSVIVPVHNDPLNLERCLDALRTSRYENYEVIVADDASTDDTPAVAESFGVRILRLDKNAGPAAARNIGAEHARGDYLMFIDADVCVNDQTLGLVVDAFEQHDDVDAVFGSYDNEPDHRGLFSQYRNLVHHFTHQSSHAEASTFWSGCGAVRKHVFLQHGGFNTDYARPCIEDIELGVRLSKAGHRIMLNGNIQATHLKRWTFWQMIKTDIFDRGVPWTQLMLANGSMPNDLNLRVSQRISALFALLYVALQLVAAYFEPLTLLFPLLGTLGILLADRWRTRRYTHKPERRVLELSVVAGLVLLSVVCGKWSLIVGAPLLAIVLLNIRFYWFFVRKRSLTFTMFVLPLHVLYYLYSVLAYGIGVMKFVGDRAGQVLNVSPAPTNDSR